MLFSFSNWIFFHIDSRLKRRKSEETIFIDLCNLHADFCLHCLHVRYFINYQPAVLWDLTSYLCESYLCELVFVCMLTATFFFIFFLDCTDFLQANAGFESASTFTLVFQTNRLTMWANQPEWSSVIVNFEHIFSCLDKYCDTFLK